MYYSVSTFGSQTSAIGLVTNPTLDATDPNYQWTDQGPVIQSAPGNNYNAIDAGIIQTPAGAVWMSFGSYVNGIYMMQLDPATGKRITPNSPLVRVADNSSIEASYVYKHNDYYYLFVNYGTCCYGVNSTYNIRVAQSTNVTGPFLDQQGRSMINNGGGTLFLGTEGQYIGPGHMGIFEDEGVEWFGYHYYNGNANGAPTYNLRTLRWSADGWPLAGLATVATAGRREPRRHDRHDRLRRHRQPFEPVRDVSRRRRSQRRRHRRLRRFSPLEKRLRRGGGGRGVNVPEPSAVLLLICGAPLAGQFGAPGYARELSWS